MSVPPTSSVPSPARAVPVTAKPLEDVRHGGTSRPKPLRPRFWPYFFLSPYFLVTAVFFVYPLCYAAVLAFYQTNGAQSRAWVGWSNFTYVLKNSDFHRSLWNTTIFAICSICLQLPLSLG